MTQTSNTVLDAVQGELKAIEATWVRLNRRMELLRKMEELAVTLDAPPVKLPPKPDPFTSPIPEPPPPAPEPEPQPPRPPSLSTVEEPPARDRPRHPDEPRPPTGKPLTETRKPLKEGSTDAAEDVLELLRLKGRPMLQQDIRSELGWYSSRVSGAVKVLAQTKRIKKVGAGGYLNKSAIWALTEWDSAGSPATTKTPDVPPMSARTRKALEAEARAAKSKHPTQPATLAGRILSSLIIGEATSRELAERLNVPEPTANRVAQTLREEGELSMGENGRWRRIL